MTNNNDTRGSFEVKLTQIQIWHTVFTAIGVALLLGGAIGSLFQGVSVLVEGEVINGEDRIRFDAASNFFNLAQFFLILGAIWLGAFGALFHYLAAKARKLITTDTNVTAPSAPQGTLESTLSPAELRNMIAEWNIVIRTQMHFNEMIMKVRTTTVSVVLAVFGAAAYSLQFEKLLLNVLGVTLHASVPVILVGLATLIGMFVVDYFYYFRMLLGAVNRGYEFDREFVNLKGHRYFGLSTNIQDAIGKPKISKYFVIIFYGLPITAGFFFLFTVIVGYPIFPMGN